MLQRIFWAVEAYKQNVPLCCGQAAAVTASNPLHQPAPVRPGRPVNCSGSDLGWYTTPGPGWGQMWPNTHLFSTFPHWQCVLLSSKTWCNCPPITLLLKHHPEYYDHPGSPGMRDQVEMSICQTAGWNIGDYEVGADLIIGPGRCPAYTPILGGQGYIPGSLQL